MNETEARIVFNPLEQNLNILVRKKKSPESWFSGFGQPQKIFARSHGPKSAE